MKVLVIGSGGREHALALARARDPEVTELHAAPGNPGIASVAELHDVAPADGAAVADLAERLGVDLVVIGPEAPLSPASPTPCGRAASTASAPPGRPRSSRAPRRSPST